MQLCACVETYCFCIPLKEVSILEALLSNLFSILT